MLSHSLKDAKDNLDIITQISREYGTSEKSCVMIFNVKEQPEHLCNIKVPYLSDYKARLTIRRTPNLRPFSSQKKEKMNKIKAGRTTAAILVLSWLR